MYHCSICLKGLKKTKKYFGQDAGVFRDSIRVPSEYKSRVLPLHTNLFGEMSYISISIKPVGISKGKMLRLPVPYLVLLNTRSVIASYTFTAPEDHFRITISQALTSTRVFTLRQQT
jgi:hypothetical protein